MESGRFSQSSIATVSGDFHVDEQIVQMMNDKRMTSRRSSFAFGLFSHCL